MLPFLPLTPASAALDMMRVHGRAFLLRDAFSTAAAAPLTSPRTAEPGPGQITFVDTTSRLSIVGGVLRHSGGAPDAYVNPRAFPSAAALARQNGRALLTRMRWSGNGEQVVGWASGSAGGAASFVHGLWVSGGGNLRLTPGPISGYVDLGPVAANTLYDVALVLRFGGLFVFIRGGAYVNWTLLWADTVRTTSPLTALVGYSSGQTGDVDLDAWQIADLDGALATDFGSATSRIAGSVAAGATFTHEADFVMEWTQTTLPTAGTRIAFRQVDANNLWYAHVTSGGDFALYEVVAGANTPRGSGSGIAAGHRILVAAEGTVIRGYTNGALKWTHPSATNHQTATGGRRGITFAAVTEDGTVSDLVTYARRPGAGIAAKLDQLAA